MVTVTQFSPEQVEPAALTGPLIDASDCPDLYPFENTSRSGYRALLGPTCLAVSDALVAVGTFTATTAGLPASPPTAWQGPPMLLLGAVGGARHVTASPDSPPRKVWAAATMLSLGVGCGLYQWALLGGPGAAGVAGMSLLLAGGAAQCAYIGAALGTADAAQPLPVDLRRLHRWMPYAGAAGLALVGGGSWYGALGLGLHHEGSRIVGEGCLVMGALLASLAVASTTAAAATHCQGGMRQPVCNAATGLQMSAPGGRYTWWSRRGSNPRPPHCERGALPAELLPHHIGPGLLPTASGSVKAGALVGRHGHRRLQRRIVAGWSGGGPVLRLGAALAQKVEAGAHRRDDAADLRRRHGIGGQLQALRRQGRAADGGST